MTAQVQHWINGRLVESTSGRSGQVYNPATGEVTHTVGFADRAQVDDAVAAATAAAAGWRETSLGARANVMFAFRQVLTEHTDELAAILTAQHGKVLDDARGEVARGVESVEFAAGIGQLLKGEFSEQASGGVDVYSIRQPLGVVAGITPFNFPIMVPLWMCANAIACGNAVVLKPSEKDPSATVELGRLWQLAGLPDGVFNVVNGDKEAVDAIIDHPDVAAISFVGSTPIARSIYQRGTAAGKRVQALGGAKNHMVVLPDADIDVAADAAVSAGYGAAGERCMAVSVVLAVGDAADPLVDAIAARIPNVVVGDGSVAGTDMGPLITAQHRDRVAGYVASASEAGARVVVDGREPAPAEGFFLNPTLLDNVSTGMDAYTDEIFGPVLSVVRCKSFDEAVALVNANQFGNGTAIFTRDGGAARRFQFEVNIGMVGINVPIPVPVSYYSFGGWKASLFGDAHMYGPDGVRFFTRTKVVTSRWPDPATSRIDLGFPSSH
jgi:malonate-semialdehyde dehydrogenase (acetylating)/methylmalonate-semialdehyde dehydrogenase